MVFKTSLYLLALTFVACASTRGAQPVAPGSTSSDVHAHAVESRGMPAWVNRGSTAVQGDGGRKFYGVGAASGIKNPALLRGAADDRARVELGKVFETFSSSLMKDTMDSDGSQNVEQAVKTLTALSLQGVQVVDRYTAADGTLYSLASLDLDRMGPALAQAKSQGLVKSDVQPVTVDDIFDKVAKHGAPVSSVMAQSDSTAAPSAKAADASDVKVRTGGKPAWVDGPDDSYANRTYLCAVGLSNDRAAAENAAYTALSKIFSAQVNASSSDFLAAYSKTGAPDLQVQSVETRTQVSTQTVLEGVRVLEVWTDAKGLNYALACLERAKAESVLQEKITGLDKQAADSMGRASSLGQADRVRELSRAMNVMLEREAANNQLRIIDLNGVGVAAAYAPADVSAALEAAVEALKVGVRAAGPYDSEFRAVLIQGLTSRGYRVTDLVNGTDTGMDVLVSAAVHLEDAGAGQGTATGTVFARAVVDVNVKNVANGTILGSLNERAKEGSRSKEEAERRAVRSLANTISNKVGPQIDASVRGNTAAK